MFAFSTTTIFSFLPQYLASYAAPHPAIPPPIISRSLSTNFVDFEVLTLILVDTSCFAGSLRYSGSWERSWVLSSSSLIGKESGGFIEPNGVVLMGKVKFFMLPFLYFTFQDTLPFSGSLRTVNA